MTKPLHPALKKGHRFSIDWPPGFIGQPYTPPHAWSGKDRSTAGRDALNKLTGKKYYSKKKLDSEKSSSANDEV